VTREPRPFFDVPRTTLPTSEGSVDFPILYYDNTFVLALFWTGTASAAAEVADQGLRPGLTWGSRAAVALACFNYRATTIGPYFEVGLAIPVVPHGAARYPRWPQALTDVDSPKRDLGYSVLHLPVTTAGANAAGREIWGLPKFITPIQVALSGRNVAVRVGDPDVEDDPILSMTGRAGLGIPGPGVSLLLYSQVDGQTLRTTVNARGTGTLRTPGNLRLSVGGGSHPMAETLRRLGLDGARPFGVFGTHRFQSRLNLGTPASGFEAPSS
jgi:hypothetical protein